MNILRYLSRSKAAWVIMKMPLVFLIVIACLRLTPWWVPFAFYGFAELAMLYYQKVRIPALRREMVCNTMFGFTRCPHGKYLPDTKCEPCAEKWVQEHQAMLAGEDQTHEHDCPVMPPKDTVFH